MNSGLDHLHLIPLQNPVSIEEKLEFPTVLSPASYCENFLLLSGLSFPLTTVGNTAALDMSFSQYAMIGILFAGLAYANPIIAPAAETSSGALLARKFTRGSHIDAAHYQTVLTEYAAGQTIASKAQTLIDEDNYHYTLFIPSKYQSEENADEYKNNFLAQFIALGNDQGYEVTIDYIGTSNDPKCQQSSQPGYMPYAYTEDLTITMCDAFFDQPATSTMGCSNTYLDEYETGAMTLLHEFTHLNPAYFRLTTSPNPPFSDYVYGSAECVSLASGRPTADQAIVNADNWMFVTLGAYWSNKCGRDIEPDEPDEGVYSGIDGEPPGCLPGATDQWIISTGGECSASGVASNAKTSNGPGGCGIPNTGGENGVNVADCWVLPQGVTAMEMTLAVTNATKVCHYFFLLPIVLSVLYYRPLPPPTSPMFPNTKN